MEDWLGNSAREESGSLLLRFSARQDLSPFRPSRRRRKGHCDRSGDIPADDRVRAGDSPPPDRRDGRSCIRGWAKARKNIFDAWMKLTDPTHLQPKVRKLNRQVATFLREHPPDNVTEEQLRRYLDSVETPWTLRDEKQLREVFEKSYPDDQARAAAVAKMIEEIGIEPSEPVQTYPLIKKDEVILVCWMALEPGDRNNRVNRQN